MSERNRKIERIVLLDQVYEALKERILDRTYEPGAKLNIDALRRELDVSSTPLREALARLSAEGLVKAAPFVGFAVAPMPSSDYYRDLYAFRLVIEPWAASETARLRPEATLDVLDAAIRDMSRHSLSRRYSRYRDFTEADEVFHHAIIAGTGNEPACQRASTSIASRTRNRRTSSTSRSWKRSAPVTKPKPRPACAST
jgi:DNA-binding GntR family transcriptional regulator